MLFRPILLMTLPPGDDDLTRPGEPYIPDIASTTQPMASPYQGDPGAPPPPPATGPVPAWRPARVPRPVDASAGSNGLLFVAGMLIAVALIAAVGIAFALAQNLGTPTPTHSTVAQGTTTTPMPGQTATSAATAAPATSTPQPTSAPSTQPGFVTYTGDAIWTIQYPAGANVQMQTATTPQGIPVPTTTFTTPHSQFQISDLPVQVPGDQAQSILQQIADSLGLEDIQIVSQGPMQIGNYTWQTLHIRATQGATRFEAILLYTTHDSGATIISMSAPVKFFDQANQDIFQPMMQSFTYTSP